MEGVDRLGWAEGMTIRVYGRDVGFRVDRPGVLPALEPFFPPGWKPSPVRDVRRLYSLTMACEDADRRTRRPHVLRMNAVKLMRSYDLERVLTLLESDVERYIADRARRRIFVHAGVVAWNGRALVLPGRTHTGKTTLVQALLRRGATYYSDEYAVLDARGRVHPYPRPLTVRTARRYAIPVRHPAEELGVSVGRKGIPVGAVVLTEFRPEARWRPRRLSEGRAVMAMLENTVPARRRPRASLEALGEVVRGAAVLRGRRGEAEKVADALLRMVE